MAPVHGASAKHFAIIHGCLAKVFCFSPLALFLVVLLRSIYFGSLLQSFRFGPSTSVLLFRSLCSGPFALLLLLMWICFGPVAYILLLWSLCFSHFAFVPLLRFLCFSPSALGLSL